MLQLTTILFLISFSLLAALHYLAIKLFLYWQVVWLDIPMHAFGGAIVALGVFTLRDLRILSPQLLSFWSVLGSVLVAAAVWEVFELCAGILMDDSYVFDTATDLIVGLAGGVVGYYVGRNLRGL